MRERISQKLEANCQDNYPMYVWATIMMPRPGPRPLFSYLPQACNQIPRAKGSFQRSLFGQ